MKIATFILTLTLLSLNSGFGQTTDSHKPISTKTTLAVTLAWMHNTLDSGLGDTATTDEVRQNRMSFTSCDVTFVYQTVKDKDSKTTYRNSNAFNLKSIDPTSISVTSGGHDILAKTSIVTFNTTDNAKLINLRLPSDPDGTSTDSLLIDFPSDYANRFVKAFRRAVILCGGKQSTF
jgi:hypothetical protein